MERQSVTARTAARRDLSRERTRPLQRVQKQPTSRPAVSLSGSSLIVGAKTLAGIGIGLVAVITGALVVGAATEAVLVPSLLLKLAGGVAGGGVGMAKGLKDARKMDK